MMLMRTESDGTQLVKYDEACRALAEARNTDEVKEVRNVAVAMECYARQAKNKQLEADAFEIRVRAERRLGEMMAQQPKAKGAIEPGTGRGTTRDFSKPASLAEVGIDKHLADRARKFAAMPKAKALAVSACLLFPRHCLDKLHCFIDLVAVIVGIGTFGADVGSTACLPVLLCVFGFGFFMRRLGIVGAG